jgi:hypothetical protein
MAIYDRIEVAKKQFGLNNFILGKVVHKEEMAFGQSMRRKSLSQLEIEAIERFLDKQGEENPAPIKDEGYSQNHYEKIINTYIDLVDRLTIDAKRIQKELDLERSKNNKM